MLIFLTGMMGSGKSTVGLKLAEELAMPFFDTDNIIESIEGMSVSDIFTVKGEDYFRNAEFELISDWKISDGIVATGGGLPCYNGLIDQLNAKGKTVFLKTSISKIVERISKDQTRPLVAGKSTAQIKKAISGILKMRVAEYNKSKIKIRSEGTTDEIVRKIIVNVYSK
ncbi:MAG: shikimate kinase [Saprospiraceae bacterium]|jgi:shikimate kinase